VRVGHELGLVNLAVSGDAWDWFGSAHLAVLAEHVMEHSLGYTLGETADVQVVTTVGLLGGGSDYQSSAACHAQEQRRRSNSPASLAVITASSSTVSWRGSRPVSGRRGRRTLTLPLSVITTRRALAVVVVVRRGGLPSWRERQSMALIRSFALARIERPFAESQSGHRAFVKSATEYDQGVAGRIAGAEGGQAGSWSVEQWSWVVVVTRPLFRRDISSRGRCSVDRIPHKRIESFTISPTRQEAGRARKWNIASRFDQRG